MNRNEIKREISILRKEMKDNGVKTTCFMNGGMDSVTRRYNERLFSLKTKLEKTP